MIKILCDRCQTEINEHENIGYIAVGNRITKVSAGEDEVTLSGTEFSENHYCQKCVEKIKAFIRSVEQMEERKEDVALSEPQKQETVPPHKPKERKKVDMGKILALRKAGWSYEKIADEMGLKPSTIPAYICNYKRKMAEKEISGETN